MREITIEFAIQIRLVPPPIYPERPRWTWAHFFKLKDYRAELQAYSRDCIGIRHDHERRWCDRRGMVSVDEKRLHEAWNSYHPEPCGPLNTR